MARVGNGAHRPKIAGVYQVISVLCGLSMFAFFIIGFWKMGEWWYPLAMLGCSLLSALIPIPVSVGAVVGLAGGPVFAVLMYLDMFGII